MDTEERERLALELDQAVARLEAERARNQAGLEAAPALVDCFGGRHPDEWLDAARRVREAGDAPLAGRLLLLHVEAVGAPHEEAWRAAEASATVAGPDGALALSDAERAVAREGDRPRRKALAQAISASMEGPARHREAWGEALARTRAAVGLYPDWEVVVAGDQLLGACDEAWRDLLEYMARRDLGLAPAPEGALERHDLLRLTAFPALDGLFRPLALARTVHGLARQLGLERTLDSGKVRVDESSRAQAVPLAHPEGARTTFRSAGGLPDWPSLLDALGRSLAAAHQPPHLRDPVFAAALGRLLAGLCLEPRWLAAQLGVERREAPDLVRALALRELLRIRTAAAALRVATEAERGLSGRAWREAHREALSAALLAAWDGVRASRDARAAPLADTVRGFAEGERLRAELRQRFDEDWWRNPRTREHLAGLLAAGTLLEGEPASPAAAAAGLARVVERGGT